MIDDIRSFPFLIAQHLFCCISHHSIKNWFYRMALTICTSRNQHSKPCFRYSMLSLLIKVNFMDFLISYQLHGDVQKSLNRHFKLLSTMKPLSSSYCYNLAYTNSWHHLHADMPNEFQGLLILCSPIWPLFFLRYRLFFFHYRIFCFLEDKFHLFL